MKKVLSLILALVMMFSLCTVAFAEDTVIEDETTTEAPAPEGTEEEAGDFDWLLDLPFWTVGPAFKFAKIALKLVKVYVKLAVIFGFIDKDDIIGQIEDLIAGAMGGGNSEETTDPVVEEDTTTGDIVDPAA